MNRTQKSKPANRLLSKRSKRPKHGKVRYAVIGQGYISQIAVLPAFAHAGRNSELTALVSDSPTKLKELGRKYGVENLYGYDEYDRLLGSGQIDAVYIALPNHLHRDYAVRAARAGVHVLCEKPLAVDASECEEMIRAARAGQVRLMTAYRLHFEQTALTAIDVVRGHKDIGEPRIFNSVFTIAVDPKNYRGGPNKKGGGPIFDVGVYCLNAARYLFRAEPTEVSAQRFGETRASEATMSVSLRFPGDRVANFVCSFGAFPTGDLQVVGTQGKLTIENAYEYLGKKTLRIETPRGKRERSFATRDQFGAELLYFSDCVLQGREPEPSGQEGLADVRVIQAALKSADQGRVIKLAALPRAKRLKRPTLAQEIRLPKVGKAKLVATKEPSRETAA